MARKLGGEQSSHNRGEKIVALVSIPTMFLLSVGLLLSGGEVNTNATDSAGVTRVPEPIHHFDPDAVKEMYEDLNGIRTPDATPELNEQPMPTYVPVSTPFGK